MLHGIPVDGLEPLEDVADLVLSVTDRLGRGAGYYDRTLIGSSAELVAVVYDDEVVDALPSGNYDVPVGWALTPAGGFRKLS